MASRYTPNSGSKASLILDIKESHARARLCFVDKLYKIAMGALSSIEHLSSHLCSLAARSYGVL